MIRPVSFLRETPLYILIAIVLVLLSLLQRIKGENSYIDTLVFLAFPGLIAGILFQLYPTIQGRSLQGRPLVYVNLALWLLSIVYFFIYGNINAYLNLLFCLSYLFIILVNTRRLRDPSVLFFLLGSLFYASASLLNLKVSNPLFIKHLINVGFFTSVVIGSYYIFVPMLQIEDLERRSIPWINLLVQLLSTFLLSLSWYYSHYKLISYSGLLLLLSLGILSYGVYHILSQRRSPLKGLDISVQFLILGLFVGWFSLLLGALTAISGNYSFLRLHTDGMLYGFLLSITIGATYHIVPFMFWWKTCAPKMGREKIPTLKEILDVKVAKFLLYSIPTLLTGLMFGSIAEPFLEKLFAFMIALALVYYAIKLIPLILKTLQT